MKAQSNQDSTGAFWNRYRAALAARGLRGKAAEWCVKRAEGFIKAAKGLRLKEHTAEDLRACFCRQATGGWLKDWQYAKADVSTTMIYTHFLNRPGLAVRSPADFLYPRGTQLAYSRPGCHSALRRRMTLQRAR